MKQFWDYMVEMKNSDQNMDILKGQVIGDFIQALNNKFQKIAVEELPYIKTEKKFKSMSEMDEIEYGVYKERVKTKLFSSLKKAANKEGFIEEPIDTLDIS